MMTILRWLRDPLQSVMPPRWEVFLMAIGMFLLGAATSCLFEWCVR